MTDHFDAERLEKLRDHTSTGTETSGPNPDANFLLRLLDASRAEAHSIGTQLLNAERTIEEVLQERDAAKKEVGKRAKMAEQKNRVVAAYLWHNGMVIAFDADGQQVPEYQGTKEDAVPRLQRDFPDLVIVGLDLVFSY